METHKRTKLTLEQLKEISKNRKKIGGQMTMITSKIHGSENSM